MKRILFIGDIVGDVGMHLAQNLTPRIIKDYNCDFCIINGENADQGKGITKTQAEKLLKAGADVISGGNHSFQKRSSEVLSHPGLRALRPANYPPGNPGQGCMVVEKEDTALVVINLQGRSYLPPIDCPFQKLDLLLKEFRPRYKNIFVDFHAEASAEKLAMGWEFDGRVSALVGTHTHVQTADARILPKGTAYITDVGMTGPADSVIGMDPDTAILRFRTQQLKYFKMAHRNPKISGVIIDFDERTGKGKKIKPFYISQESYDASSLA